LLLKSCKSRNARITVAFWEDAPGIDKKIVYTRLRIQAENCLGTTAYCRSERDNSDLEVTVEGIDLYKCLRNQSFCE
jgi:hypothetical protein